MLSGWLIILISITYLLLLFGIAYYGDKSPTGQRWANHPIVYSLSLAVYCSSWTFYGAVGRASTTGWEFMATYLGPVIIFILGWRMIEKMILVSKQQNITTIADFISSRYGKSQSLAVMVTIIAVLGTIPYIALQLKAVAISYNAIAPGATDALSKGSDTALFVTVLMVIFSILFGTRHIDATEHHPGLVLAVAFESVVKLTAFLAVGFFVVFYLFEGPANMLSAVSEQLRVNPNFQSPFAGSFLTETLLACAAIICLPRQFHVTVVENTNTKSLFTARWLFPLYIMLLGLFVLPIAVSGLDIFAGSKVDADVYVLMLPSVAGWEYLTVFAFIGGLSAATSMVIVASIALATMVCNDIIMPLLLRIRWLELSRSKDLGALLLRVRRITIVGLMLLAYFYYRVFGDHGPLASFGLLSFVAAIQFLPAIVGGIYWKEGTRYGVLSGMSAGMFLWCYTLVIPTMRDANVIPNSLDVFLPHSLNTSEWLQPTALFGISGMDPLTHGVFWSLSINVLLYILVSRLSNGRLVDRIQASAYINAYNKDLSDQSRLLGQVTVGDLQTLTERFLGPQRTEHALTGFALQRGEAYPLSGDNASSELIQYTERLLAGVIGASSARIVMDSTLRGKEMQIGDVVAIVDEASQALRFNRSLLQSTIENIGMGISVVDQHLRLVAWNKQYVSMFDYPDGLVCIGRPIVDIFRHNAMRGEYGGGETEVHVEMRLRLLQDREPHSYERLRPDGTVLEVRGNPMPNGGYVNTYMDITEHKRIEEALRESEQNIRVYTDNVPVLIAYLDPQLRYLFVNKAYADTFGIDRHNIAGVPCYQVLPPEEYELRRSFIDRALAGERQRFETRLPSKDGSMRYAEVTYIPHRGEHGDLMGYFTLYQDITERRHAEIALQENNENLENRVRERTLALSVANKDLRKENTIRALMEDELRQAKSEAEAANLGKTRFLAAASHDLLQPLNAARLFTSALAQHSYETEVNQLVQNLDGSLRAAEELITTILDISKLDAGALDANPRHFSLESLLNNLSTEFKALANERELNFRHVHSNKVVYSDPTLLRRILQNFLSNAMRYTQTGKVLLGARRRGQHLRLEVWDTGVGIPENKIKEVFEEFKRIDNPRHSEVKGLGLGLSITERIARMLGHEIQVRSWQGKGSVFSVTVPMGQAQLAVKDRPEQRGWIRSKGLNGIHVLVIDNEPKILEGMSALLKGWSCEIITALSANEAEAKIRQQSFTPDIILADYHLSDIHTGIMALEQLKPLWRQPIPTIVITADRTEAVKEEIEVANAQLLTKPVRPAALRAMINRLIAQARE